MEKEKNKCPVCKLESESIERITTNQPDPIRHYDCPRCRKYRITDIAESNLEYEHAKQKLSAWLREQNEYKNNAPLLDEQLIEQLDNNLPNYSPSQKQNKLLKIIEKKTKYPGKSVRLNKYYDYPLAWADHPSEFEYYINSLAERGLIKSMHTINDIDVQISPDGWDYIERDRLDLEEKTQAFVAMSFSDEMKSIWENAIKPAIVKSGYKPYRIDAEPHNERIDVKIMAEIKNSRFIVADFTENKHGVYFEAGYALGLNIPVIWCIKESDLKKVHFDTRQYNHIPWKDETDLREKLYYFICVIVGKKAKDNLLKEIE